LSANRLTAFIDACALAGVLRRNLLLTLAEAELFRIRWSSMVMDETQSAIEGILTERGLEDAAERAARARTSMETAFDDAMVVGFEALLNLGADLPDPDDAHVVAAAVKTAAAILVTDNLKDFPASALGSPEH
jgi:hypothetical protein